jgi:hypothetical protein
MLLLFCRVILSWFFRRRLNLNVVGQANGFDWGGIVREALLRRRCRGLFEFRITRGWIRSDRWLRCLNDSLPFLVPFRPHFQVSRPTQLSTEYPTEVYLTGVRRLSSAKEPAYFKRTDIFALRIYLNLSRERTSGVCGCLQSAITVTEWLSNGKIMYMEKRLPLKKRRMRSPPDFSINPIPHVLTLRIRYSWDVYFAIQWKCLGQRMI